MRVLVRSSGPATAWLVAACVALSPTGIPAQASAAEEVLPVTLAEDLLDDAMRQELSGTSGLPVRRSRSGRVALVVLLAGTLFGTRLLVVRRTAARSREGGQGDGDKAGADPGTSVDDGRRRGRDGRSVEDRAQDGHSDRPYRSRRTQPDVVPLALPPHVMAILARTSAPGAAEGPAPYHAPDSPPTASPAPEADEPPAQRLDLVVPGFTPWRKQK